MSLGLPAHLAPQVIGRSFVRAQHTMAMTCLVMAILASLVFQSAYPSSTLSLAAASILPAVVLLWAVGRRRSALWSACYLLFGAVGVYAFVSIFLAQSRPLIVAAAVTGLALKVALIMVGGTGIGVLAGAAWSTAGFLLGELAVGLALVQAGQPLRPDVALLVFLATLAALPLFRRVSSRARTAQPRLHKAARDEQVAALRYRVEVKAAALMHDTVLNHLAAISDTVGDALAPDLREQIQRDLESLAGEEWLAETPDSSDSSNRVEWQHSGLFTAIQESRLLGLTVEATGDLTAVARLDRESSIALGLAVKQCLVNVLKHSGTTVAEVAVYGSGSEVSVMVVDTGRGFSEATAGANRLGLRTSVRRRIETIGGTVQVWSAPGRGTSIVIRVPARQKPGSATTDAELASAASLKDGAFGSGGSVS